MVFADYGAGLVPLNAGGALAARIKTVGARVGAAVQVARGGATPGFFPTLTPKPATIGCKTGQIQDASGNCVFPNLVAPPPVYKPAEGSSCIVSGGRMAPVYGTIKNGVCVGAVFQAPPTPPSTGAVDSMGIPRCPPGQGANSEKLPDGRLNWTCKPLPTGWQACGANMYWDQATGRCRITGSAIVSPTIAPPPPAVVAPQPVPPVTLPAPVPIPVPVQPGTAAAAAVETINQQAQLTQQQVQAAQAGMGTALGAGVGGLLLMALLLR